MREFVGYVLANMENVDRKVRQLYSQNRNLVVLSLCMFGMILIQDKRMRLMDNQLNQVTKKLDVIQKEDKE